MPSPRPTRPARPGSLTRAVAAAACLLSLAGAPATAAAAAPSPRPGCTVTGDFARRYAEPAVSALLGACVGDEAPVDRGGVAQPFQGGSLYWNPATGSHPVAGAIRARYAELAWENSPLGFPTTDEFGVRGGRGQHFQGGSVYWSPGTGAHTVSGEFRRLWAGRGWENSSLGFPTSDEVVLGVEGGRLQRFQGGSLYWTPGIGARSVGGAILAAWGATGWEGGDLGYPVSDEHDVPGGRRSDFQFGHVTWDAVTGRTGVTRTLDVRTSIRPESWHPGAGACRVVDQGYNGQRVKLVQRRLGVAGSEPEWNRGVTTTAIRAFQRSHGLPVTGDVDRATWDRMGLREDFCMDGYQQPVQVAPDAAAAQRVEKMVEVAHRYLGEEYVWGGTGPVGYGVDCSGLVLQAMLAAGLSPRPVTVALHPLADYRTTVALYGNPGLRHVPRAQVQRGDLVFYTSNATGRIVHVALALGGGKMIEAPNQSAPVRVVDITTTRGAETIAPEVVRPFA